MSFHKVKPIEILPTKPKPVKTKLIAPTLEERIDRLKKDNEVLDKIRKKYNPNYVSYVSTIGVPIKTRLKIKKSKLDIYKEKLFNQKLKPNGEYKLLKNKRNNERLINALANNYNTTVGNAIKISKLISMLNQAQVQGVLYFLETKKLPIIKLEKKIQDAINKNIN